MDDVKTFMSRGLRIAVEGCSHGALDAIYASVRRACRARNWPGVDLVLIGGDFQAARNTTDLSVMSVPAKYRRLGDFPAYYAGTRHAPYLTLFVGGNHEASAYLAQLHYGGWVAPRIYYMGAANVVRVGGVRVAAMSGIWKGYDYRKGHYERLPYNRDDVKSVYHVREMDVRKLLQVRTQVDIGVSHDWPRGVERYGDTEHLFRMKPDFRQESADGQLGNPAATYVMDRLRPAYWFSAHLHCKFAAIKTYEPPSGAAESREVSAPPEGPTKTSNPDEIGLDLEDGDESDDHRTEEKPTTAQTVANAPQPPQTAITTTTSPVATAEVSGGISEELRAQLPASFRATAARPMPGQPIPPTITNTTVRFLALDKCLPGRQYIQLCEIQPVSAPVSSITATPNLDPETGEPAHRLEYDLEWLAITRVFAKYLTFGGDPSAMVPPDLGEDHYRPLIDAEMEWVDANIVKTGKLQVPENFATTAQPHSPGSPESTTDQPEEYTDPQTDAYCQLLAIQNPWEATEEERASRRMKGRRPERERGAYDGGGHRGSHNNRRGWRGGGGGGRRGR